MTHDPPVRNWSAVLIWGAILAAPEAAWAQPVSDATQFRFERQLRVNPFDPAALNNLAVVKAGQGRFDDAHDLLQRAARLAPASTEITANLMRLRAWMETLGRDPAALDPPALGLSNIPPEPPPLWDPTPPGR